MALAPARSADDSIDVASARVDDTAELQAVGAPSVRGGASRPHRSSSAVQRVTARARGTWAAVRSSGRLSALEIAVVAAVAVVVQAVVFRGWYLGTTSPNYDFLGGYTSEAFAWWRDGGLLSPPAWSPYLWGGSPTAASIQNSSWYLPVGLASIFDYDIHMAAALQGVHAALAGLGVYVLGRRAGFGRLASMVGLVAYPLTTGFFSNASYIDIVRGHAFAPWLLLLLSPLFPWRRWWAVPVAAVFFWQAAVGIYPGMLAAYAYAGGAWALTWQFARRPAIRQFLLPAMCSSVLGLLLAMPKYMPLVGLHLLDGREVSDISVLPVTSLGTFLLPVYPGIPGLPSMESSFLPAAALLLAALVRFRDTAVRAGLVAGGVALFLSAPSLPLRELVDVLPGMSVSRFRLNDFRPFIWLAVVVAAMSGFSWLLQHGTTGVRGRALARRLVLVLAVPTAAVIFLVFDDYRRGPWVPLAVVLAISTVLVLGLVVAAQRRWLSRTVAPAATVLVLVCTVASGLVYSRTVTPLWNSDTLAMQNQLWGATSAQLIQQHVAPAARTQRPARSVAPVVDNTQQLVDAGFNSAYYTGLPSTVGYINIQGSASITMLGAALADPATADSVRELMAAPGMVISRWSGDAGEPSVEDVRRCVDTGTCGSLTVTPVAYEPGHLAYRLTAEATEQVLLNEAYYPGWTALLVDDGGRSTVLEPQRGPAGTILLDLPAGSWRLTMTYRTPFEDPAKLLALLGLAGTALVAVVVWRRERSVGRRTSAQD